MSGRVIVRERVCWSRWDAQRLRMRTSHPLLWRASAPDGEDRYFDTEAEAEAWLAGCQEEA